MTELWRSPDEKPGEEPVMVITKSNHGGKERIHRVAGMWIERFTEEAGAEEWAEYNEEKDEYYLPEGWYEQQLYNSDDCAYWLISDEVVAWMPLPRYEP